jgi:NAD(P)H-flavin reductase
VHDIEAQDVLVVAGGIGLAPVRPAILHLLRHRGQYGRVIVLVGARTPADLLFVDELHRWRGRFDLEVQVTVDHASEAWHGPVGVVTRLLETTRLHPEHTALLTCGPEIMMSFVVREALRQHIPPDRIWLSMERNMKCAIGLCGHCQWGRDFLCRTGPVMRWDQVSDRFSVRGL